MQCFIFFLKDTEEKIIENITNILTGDFITNFGTFAPDLKENVEMVKELREQFQQEWKLLQCSGKQSEVNENKM